MPHAARCSFRRKLLTDRPRPVRAAEGQRGPVRHVRDLCVGALGMGYLDQLDSTVGDEIAAAGFEDRWAVAGKGCVPQLTVNVGLGPEGYSLPAAPQFLSPMSVH